MMPIRLTALFIFLAITAMAQPRMADYLSLGINAGTANYRDLQTDRGFGMHVSADLNINSWMFANVTGTFTNYEKQANTFVMNFGIKAFPNRLVYIHPYVGFANIFADPETVKRGSIGLGIGSAVKTGKRHLNFEACGEYLPFYASGTYYLFGRFSVPILIGNVKDR